MSFLAINNSCKLKSRRTTKFTKLVCITESRWFKSRTLLVCIECRLTAAGNTTVSVWLSMDQRCRGLGDVIQ